MHRGALIALGFLAVTGALLAGYAYWTNGELMPEEIFSPRPAQVVDDPASAEPGTTETRVVAEALIVPARSVALSFAVPGRVAEVLVKEGDSVEVGQIVARLKSDFEALVVAQAQSEVDKARAQVELLQSGARPEELAAAQAAIDAAQAQVDILKQGPREEDVAAAAAALAAAQAQYATVATGADEQDLIAARMEMQNAEALVTQAQRAYDQISWRADIGTTFEAAALQTATNEFLAAQARYEALAGGAQPSQLAEAAALIDQARAQLERLQVPPTENEIAAAEAAVRQAQAAYDLIAAGYRTEEIAIAQGELSAAETLLLQAQLALSERELRAPIEGVVASIVLWPGQDVSEGTPIAQIADQSAWMAQTTDLNEINVVEVGVGDRAGVRVDAIPDLQLDGHVIAVSQMGANILGDVNFTVTVQLDDSDPRLRWNMTASVEFE